MTSSKTSEAKKPVCATPIMRNMYCTCFCHIYSITFFEVIYWCASSVLEFSAISVSNIVAYDTLLPLLLAL